MMEPLNYIELEAKVDRHSFDDMKQWWKHMAKSFGPMVAQGADENAHELRMYHKKLHKFAVMTEIMVARYTNEDTQMEIRQLHRKAMHLLRHVEHMIKDAEMHHDEERVESKVSSSATAAAATPSVRDTTDVPVEGRYPHTSSSKHSHHGGGSSHGRDGHGRYARKW